MLDELMIVIGYIVMFGVLFGSITGLCFYRPNMGPNALGMIYIACIAGLTGMPFGLIFGLYRIYFLH